MKDLFHCKSCGFISTIANSYKMKKGVLFCKSCLKSDNANILKWIKEAIEKNKERKDKRE